MKQRISLAVLLIAIICECGWLAMMKHSELEQAKLHYEQATAEIARRAGELEQLEQELDALNAEYEKLKDPAMADLQQQIEAMEAQKVEIQAQIESIKLAIEEGKQNPEEEINEYSYYEEVYNALKEGLEKVKGYISGN